MQLLLVPKAKYGKCGGTLAYLSTLGKKNLAKVLTVAAHLGHYASEQHSLRSMFNAADMAIMWPTRLMWILHMTNMTDTGKCQPCCHPRIPICLYYSLEVKVQCMKVYSISSKSCHTSKFRHPQNATTYFQLTHPNKHCLPNVAAW